MTMPKLENLLIRWTRFCEKHSILVLLTFLPILVLAVFLILTRLGINTDVSDMISEKLEFHHQWKLYRSEFPNLNDTFIVVLKSDQPGVAYEAAREVSEEISSSLEFESSLWLTGGDFFERNQLLFEDKEQLKEKLQDFSRAEPLMNIYASQASPEALSLVAASLSGSSQAQSFVSQIIENLKNPKLGINYAQLVFPNDGSAQYLEIRPKLNYENFLPAEVAYKKLKSILENAKGDFKIGAGITGSAALSYEEMRSVSEGAGFSGILSLVLVTLILIWGIKSFPLIGLSLGTLIVGLVLTAAFAAVAVGHLNIISIAFAVLFIGLGVDYSVHLSLRYRDLLLAGESNAQALEMTIQEIGVSLVLCTLTTTAGFYAFIPTAYSGVSELGLISGTGMIINLLIHLSIFPAFFHLFPLKVKRAPISNRSIADQISLYSFVHPKRIAMIGIPLFLISLPALFFIKFDPNPLNMQNPNTEAYTTFRGLMKTGENSPWSIKILVNSEEEEKQISGRLQKLDSVSQVISLSSFIPSDQDEKLQMMKSLKLPALSDQISSLRRQGIFQQATLQLSQKQDSESKEFLKLMKEKNQNNMLSMNQAVQDSNTFYSVLRSFENTQKITEENLPREWKSRFIGQSGKRKIEVFPNADLMKLSEMKKFSDEVRSIAPQATDDPVTLPLAGEAVVGAFLKASVIASILIFVFAFLMTFSIRDSFLVFVPLVFSAIVLKALMVVLKIDFNFANIIVLPLLLGIGIDSGLHLIHRFRTKDPDEAVSGSTQRAVFVSALTTVMSFGTLAFSPHQGTASMGVLLTIGTLVIMLSTLSLLPALISGTIKEKLKQAA